MSTHHVLGTAFHTGDSKIKNLLLTFKEIIIQWEYETITLSIKRKSCVPGRKIKESTETKESVEHSRSCQFLYFLWSIRQVFMWRKEGKKSMHGFWEMPRIGKFRGTESRIELTRYQEQEERGSYYLWLQCFIGEMKKKYEIR